MVARSRPKRPAVPATLSSLPVLAAAHSVHVVATGHCQGRRPLRCMRHLAFVAKPRLHPERGGPVQLCLGKRPQAQQAGTAGKRLADRRNCQKVRRAGQQETARRRVDIDSLLDGPHDPVSAELDLVDHQRMVLVKQEAAGVGQSGLPGGVVVQRCVRAATLCGHHPGQRRLAALPGTVEHDHSEVVQGLLDPRHDVSRNELHALTVLLISRFSHHSSTFLLATHRQFSYRLSSIPETASTGGQCGPVCGGRGIRTPAGLRLNRERRHRLTSDCFGSESDSTSLGTFTVLTPKKPAQPSASASIHASASRTAMRKHIPRLGGPPNKNCTSSGTHLLASSWSRSRRTSHALW